MVQKKKEDCKVQVELIGITPTAKTKGKLKAPSEEAKTLHSLPSVNLRLQVELRVSG